MAITRRELLKISGATAAAAAGVTSLPGIARADESDGAAQPTTASNRDSVWRQDGRYFVQDTVDTTDLAQGVIRARVDGVWRGFRVRELNDDFLDWNMIKRIEMMDNMMGGNFDIYNDAHNAAVGTYGALRGDSALSINVAYKGMGWVPRADLIEERSQLYHDHAGDSTYSKMQTLKDGYHDRDLWRRDMLGSLELYTTINYETHTFLNQVANPVSSICFLDSSPSFKVQTIARLMHYRDPNLTEEEQKIVTWINYAHEFFHGSPPLTVGFSAVAYYVVEQFDNSPWGTTDDAGGHRVVPRM